MERRSRITKYAAFISYSHTADGMLAPAIQKGLQRLARPWNRRHALRVFRDDTGLAVSPDLWASIEKALDSSEFFVLMASPEAANSAWVNREIQHWIANQSADRILPVLTEGEWVWSVRDDDFDWERSSSVPKSLRGAFREEPHHLDVRWARAEDQLDLRHSRFRGAIANLAVPLHGIDKDELESEDIRQQRRTRRLAWAAGLGLAALAIIAIIAGALAVFNAARAVRQAQIATSRQLAAQSRTYVETRPDLGLLLSLESFSTSPTTEARGSILATLLHDPSILTYLRGHEGTITSSAFSPDSQLLASASVDVILWDLASRQVLDRLSTDASDIIWSLAFSPDGRILATGDGDGTLVLWDMADHLPLGAPLEAHTDRIAEMEFSPDGKILATGSDDGNVILWDASTLEPIGDPVHASPEELNALTFSPDGQVMASTGVGGVVIMLWDVVLDLPLGEPLFPRGGLLGGHTENILDLAFSPDGQMLASAGSDNTIVLWNLSTQEPIGEPLKGHVDSVKSVTFSPDGEILASAGLDKTVILWEVATREPIGEPRSGHIAPVETLSFSPDGKFLASGGRDRTIVLRDVAGRDISGRHPLAMTLYGHRDIVTSLAYHPDGNLLASGDAEGFMVLWDLNTRQPIRTHDRVHTDVIRGLSFHPSGDSLVSASSDESIAMWDSVHRQEDFRILREHMNPVLSVEFSPDGKSFASADAVGNIILWDASNGEQIGKLRSNQMLGIAEIRFSPDGERLAAAGFVNGSGGVLLWEVVGQTLIGQPLQRQATPAGVVNVVAFSPDGQTLATGDSDGVIVLWDLITYHPIGEQLIGHNGQITGLAFTPDGQMLVSTGFDANLILWDTLNLQPLVVIPMDERRSITGLAISPDGDTLATAGFDGSIVLLDLNLDSWRSLACGIVNRNLTVAEFGAFLGADVPYRATCPDFSVSEVAGSYPTKSPVLRDIPSRLTRIVKDILSLLTGEDAVATQSTEGGLEDEGEASDPDVQSDQVGRDGLGVFSLEDMLGRWQIVWDKGAPYEESLQVDFDHDLLREFDVEVTDDGHVTFVDDEGCEHVGTLNISGDFASGTYKECAPNPLWAGVWEAGKTEEP